MAATVDWLLANRPAPGGELERQIGDPFDYEREDELVARRGARLARCLQAGGIAAARARATSTAIRRSPAKRGAAGSRHGGQAIERRGFSTALLEGVRVLDFTTAMAGPTASMLLADFGAEVLKVEPPEGESSRRWGSARFGPGSDTSGLFLALNRNKASITLDLKSDEGAAAVERLVRDCDVVMESFKPGVADRLGIGYERLAAIRPGLVYASVSGFGAGPVRCASSPATTSCSRPTPGI